MTQFKFGDKVRHPNFDSPCVFIDQLYDAETKEKTWAIVLNENEYDKITTKKRRYDINDDIYRRYRRIGRDS